MAAWQRLVTLQFLTGGLLVVAAVLGCAEAGPRAAQAEPADAQPATPSEIPASVSGPQDAKPKRPPIYDTEVDGKELIAAAVKRATLEHKHVLIEWGGNWCGWCYKLHDVFHNDELVHPIVAEEYELVLVDSTNNRELMESYGGKDTRYAYPHLTILDAQGNVLTNQETGALEDGPKHDPQAVAAFLKKWQPEKVDAEELLAAALKRATAEDKRVLVHVGTPYCGWCKVLTRFLDEQSAIFSRDYVDLKLDTLRMTHGEAVAARYLPEGSNGVPWMVILDASGKVLSTGVGPGGNIGYPYDPAEVEHFLAMLSSTRQRLGDDDLQAVRVGLEKYRAEREQKLTAERAAK